MGLFSKIFGSKKTDLDSVVEATLTGILEKVALIYHTI
jgi:hypothetical protein